jgi:hypothetical protein
MRQTAEGDRGNAWLKRDATDRQSGSYRSHRSLPHVIINPSQLRPTMPRSLILLALTLLLVPGACAADSSTGRFRHREKGWVWSWAQWWDRRRSRTTRARKRVLKQGTRVALISTIQASQQHRYGTIVSHELGPKSNTANHALPVFKVNRCARRGGAAI